MASLYKDGAGWRILFCDPDSDARPSIRLGKIPRRSAESINTRVEALVSDKASGYPHDADLAGWLRTIPDALADKLAKAGLIPERETAIGTVNAFVDAYISGRGNLKPNTLRNYRQTKRYLAGFFADGKRLADVTPGDADQYKEYLVSLGLAGATISRELKRARQFFRVALRRKIIHENPFADVKGGKCENSSRYYFVTREEIQKVLDACPDAEWRLIVALARFGGLRCPSEILALTWRDIDWAASRIRVPSPKTEAHEGGASRSIPMYSELRPHLEAVFDGAEPGTKHVITHYRESNLNLRSRLLDIIWAAGLKEWPKLFQNMRSTRETELAETFPMQVVCKWIGNSQQVAANHYLQVTDEHYERAIRGDANPVQNPAQYAHKLGGTGRDKKRQAPIKPESYEGLLACTFAQVPPRGVEPLSLD